MAAKKKPAPRKRPRTETVGPVKVEDRVIDDTPRDAAPAEAEEAEG